MAKWQKNKGKQYEKEIAKELSLWWSFGNRDDIFGLTSGSGSRATIRRQQRGILTEDSYGDLMALHELGKPFTNRFLIEIKRGYSNQIDLLGMLDTPKRQKKGFALLDWWEKACEECDFCRRKDVLIIFRRDRKVSCIAMHYNVMIRYELGTFQHLGIWTSECLSVLKLEDFLKIDPSEMGAQPILRRRVRKC